MAELQQNAGQILSLVKEVQDYTESTEKSVHQFQDPK
jgi:hypothetical protein